MAGIKEQLDELRIDRTEESAETLRKQRRRWVSVVLLALLVLGAIFWWVSRPRAAAVRLATAREVTVGAQRTVLNASGYVTARRQATVSSKITGRVIEVLIEEGMEVEAGQVMARVDDSNFRVSFDLAEAEVRAAQTALGETRVREREAELELARVGRLVTGGIASQADLDAAQAARDALAARLAQQQDEVTVARRRVAVWRQQLADTEIVAPFAGVIVSKNAQPGEMISPVAAGGGFTRSGIGTVVDMESLEIEVDVNESYINRVRPGQEVAATLDAYPDWEIAASVIAIVPTADRQRATVKVRIGFDELDRRILPDMGIKVAFRESNESGRPQARVVVPTAALRRVAGRDTVFVVADSIVEKRAVTIGGERDGETVLLSGVSAGEHVVVEGPEMTGGERVVEGGD